MKQGGMGESSSRFFFCAAPNERDEQTSGLQLHNSPEVTAIPSYDVMDLCMGMSHGAFWAVTIAGFGTVTAMALIAHHEMENQKMQMLTLPGEPALR